MFKIDENWFFWWMNSQLQSKYSWNNESVMWGLSANESDEYLFVMNWQSPFGVVTNWDGIEWRQFGITHSSLNCVLLLKNILVSMNIHWHKEERWWHESFVVLNWLFQWDGHKTGIVIAIDGDVCQTVSVKWQLCSSWLYFTFSLLEGMTLMSLWLNWWMNMVTQ